MEIREIEPRLEESFIRLIAQKTGLQVREQDRKMVTQKIQSRMKRLKLSLPDTYYRILETENTRGIEEWQELILLLTNIESYFFRDQGQFKLLKEEILPKIIEEKRLVRTIRIWSAGCSNGEEIYSIAILLKNILPELEQWNCLLLGTDINEEVLKRGRAGIYNPWSLRVLNSELKGKYFEEYGKEYILKESIRKLVEFRTFNLVQDDKEQNTLGINNFDLIVCRNVFIYFTKEGIKTALDTFKKMLKPGGYLITGHSELYGQDIQGFQSKVYPESIIYERQSALEVPGVGFWEKKPEVSKKEVVFFPPVKPKIISPNLPLSINIENQTINLNGKLQEENRLEQEKDNNENIEKLLEEAEKLFKQKSYQQAIEKTEKVLEKTPLNFRALYLLAEIQANAGQYEEAVKLCKKALQVNPFSVSIYYLLAQIAEEKGDNKEAKRIFKRIIYLEPTSIYAYYELSYLYEQESDHKRAHKMHRAALDILQKVPPDSPIYERGQMTASELIEKIEKKLKDFS